MDTEKLIEEALDELASWERAYPLPSFPEPDLGRARTALENAGLTLDSVSASNMRHVISCLAPKCRDALEASTRRVKELSVALEACACVLESQGAYQTATLARTTLDGQ